MPGTVTVPLRSQTNASPFWIILLLVYARSEHGRLLITHGERHSPTSSRRSGARHRSRTAGDLPNASRATAVGSAPALARG